MFCITTCNASGYEAYGRRMIDTFLEFWPKEIGLVVYAEGWTPQVKNDRLLYIDINSIDDLVAFKARHTFNEKAHGRFPGRGYDYRMDAVRFAHKVFAVLDATEKSNDSLAMWLDADTVTHQRIPLKFIQELVPKNVYTAYLGRPNHYPECGFVAYRPQQPVHHAFMRSWRLMYAEDSIFHLDEWHDCWAYDWLRKEYEAKGWLRSFDLAGGLDTHHPFINSPLGQYMDHFKGDRKVFGRTPPGEMIVGHKAPHWKWGDLNAVPLRATGDLD